MFEVSCNECGAVAELEEVKDIRDTMYGSSYLDDRATTVDPLLSALSAAPIKMVKGEIMSVISVEYCNMCIACNSKVVKRTGLITECTKCGSMQKEKKGDVGVIAKIAVEEKTTGEVMKLTLFENILQSLVQGRDKDKLENCH